MKKEYNKPTMAVMSLFAQTIICGSDDYSIPTEEKDSLGPKTAPGRRLYI